MTDMVVGSRVIAPYGAGAVTKEEDGRFQVTYDIRYGEGTPRTPSDPLVEWYDADQLEPEEH